MSRFDPTNEELHESLQWHAKITIDLQGRIVEARRAAASHPAILQILDTPHAPETVDMVPAAAVRELVERSSVNGRLVPAITILDGLRALLPEGDA